MGVDSRALHHTPAPAIAATPTAAATAQTGIRGAPVASAGARRPGWATGAGVWWSARESTPITEQSPGPSPSRSPVPAGPTIAQAPAGASGASPSAGQAPVPGTAPATSATPAAPVPAAAPATPTTTPADAATSPAAGASGPKAAEEFSPHGALDAIHAARDPGWGVDIRLSATSVRIGRDPLRFEVRSARPGYLYVLMVGTDTSNFFQLFPNAIDGDTDSTSTGDTDTSTSA